MDVEQPRETDADQVLQREGIPYRIKLPSPRFNRKIGPFSESLWLPDGSPARSAAEVAAHLPSADDVAWLEALQSGPVLERGKSAHWISAPTHKIDAKPLGFACVRFA